jgi:hypothetical protein
MYLILWVVFLVISFIIVTIGLFRPEHTEMALIGFVFIFLLSLNLEVGTIDYKMGTNISYACLCCDNSEQAARYGTNVKLCDTPDNSTMVKISEIDIYETWNGGGTLGHLVGYWLMIMSIVGFVGVLLSIRAQRFN